MERTEVSKSLNLVWHPHPISAIADREVQAFVFTPGLSVRQILLKSGIDPIQPIYVVLDDKLLTVKQWDTVYPEENQILNVMATIQGGGGGGSNTGQIIAMVAIIAIAIAAPYAAGALGYTALGAGTLGGSLLSAGVMIAGSLVVGAIFQPKTNTGLDSTGGTYDQPSPTYSLSGGSNRQRPYESMPVIMGTHKFFPDYGSKPYTEYSGEDQYLYQIFHLGLSDASYYNWKIGTNPITNYSDYTWHTTDANGNLTTFPGNVDTQAGTALTFEAGWISRTTSENTYKARIDISAILYFANDSGGMDSRTVNFEYQYKLSGGSSWSSSITQSISGNSQKPLRNTYEIVFPSTGTYDIRIKRNTADSTNAREQTTTSIDAIRSYQLDEASYVGQKRIGLVIRASEQLNGVVQQLSVDAVSTATFYDGENWITGETSNPAHWFMDFARGKYDSNGKLVYGVGLSESQLDLQALVIWAGFCNEEGLSFNAVLDSSLTAADVLNSIARCGFGSPSWASGKLGIVFDARQATPVAAFGMSNIIKDTFDVTYITEELADEIVVRYVNPDNDWNQSEVRVLVPGVTDPIRTSTIDVFGCTDTDMAGKFANYLAAQQYYRRRRISWETDFQGFVCNRGDVVLLSHDLTQWGYSGRIVSIDENEVTIDRHVPRNGEEEYLMLVKPDGSTTIYDVEAASEDQDVLTLTENIVLQEGYLPIDHMWFFSPLATPGKKVKITSVTPSSESRVRITATDEYDEFYDAWDGTFIQPTIDTLLPSVPVEVTSFALTNRIAIENGYRANRVNASWRVSGSTQHSIVKVYFEGNLVLEQSENLTGSVELDFYAAGTVTVYVTPVGIGSLGETESATLVIGALDAPPPPESVYLSYGEDGKSATFTWDRVFGAQSYVVEIVVGGTIKRAINVGNTLSYEYNVEQASVDGGPFRTYTARVYSVANEIQSETYSYATFENAQIGALSNIRLTPLPNSIWIEYDKPSATDFAGVQVWMSTDSFFSPSSATLVYDGAETWVTITADADGDLLEAGELYHIYIAGYDTFGKDSYTLSSKLSTYILSPVDGMMPGDITSTYIADAAITTAKIADAAIQSAKIANAAIKTANIEDAAITTAKIGDAQITNAKIADATIGSAKIADAAITTAKIADANITTAKIADANITTAKIGDGQITNAKIDNVIQSNVFISGTSGWRIDKTGNMELNSAVFRGSLDVKSATSGARMQVTNSQIAVFDSAGTLRVLIGNLG